MPLNQLKIQNAKPKEKPYKLGDSGGLYLYVTPTGGRCWRFKYRWLNKEKVLSFGLYPDLSLAEAREKRDDARKLKAKNIDPAEYKKQQRQLAITKDRNTFEHVAREWHEWKWAKKSPYYAKQIMQRLQNDVFPKIGNRPISAITAAELLKVARAIEDRGALELSRRAVQICGQVFQYAIITERAESNPSINLRGFLKTGERKHRAYVTKQELPSFVEALEAYDGSDKTKLAIKLLMLTMVRPNELCQAQWSEIDLDGAQWLIPADRMKMRTAHLVPLSAQACEILRLLKRLGLQRKSAYVFPNERAVTKGMTSNTLLFALYAMGFKDRATSHGFRATASTILNESGLFERDVIERQLAHQERNRVRAAYDHAEHFPARRNMMQWWGDTLSQAGLR
ncbi:MAG: integrase arm-type DNA-binding domain-containing protein [Pseudomonadota bacterium]